MQTYTSNEFLNSAGVSRQMQATGEAPSQKTSMKRRSCEVPLGDISTQNFKVSLADLSNDQNYDCRSLRSTRSENYQQRNYRPIDSRSVKNFRSSLIDISTYSLSRPPSYDQLSRRSIVEGPDQGNQSSIEGVLWSDEEETEYFYHENIQAAWNQGKNFMIICYHSGKMPRGDVSKLGLISTYGISWGLPCFRRLFILVLALNDGGTRTALNLCRQSWQLTHTNLLP